MGTYGTPIIYHEFDAGDKVNLCLNLGLEDGSAGKLSFAVQEGGPDPEL